jgi:hypothetical protein
MRRNASRRGAARDRQRRLRLASDADKTVDAMIAATDAERPALRLALGTAFESISSALTRRLAAIEAQGDIAYSADREPPDAKG